MGQFTVPSSGGITVIPTDRETGPGAGGGASGNRSLFLGASAGLNTTQSDLIILGNGSFKNVVDPGSQGSVVVGSGSLPVDADLTTDALAGISGAVTLIGWNNYASMGTGRRLAGSILIGAKIASAGLGQIGDINARNILVGNGIWNNNLMNAAGSNDNVIVGHGISTCGATFTKQHINNVLIGSRCGPQGSSSGGTVGNAVIIGAGAANILSTINSIVVIGASAGQGMSSANDSIIIGTSANLGNCSRSTVVGSNSAPSAGADDGLFLGYSAGVSFTGVRCIVIGRGAGTTAPTATADQLLIETNDGTPRAWIYGSANGNLALGNLTNANRDLSTIACTNGVKLTDGVRGAGSPAGGGFFYSSSGILHWVSSGGVDTTLGIATSGQLVNSGITLTNNAAAQVATITNGPTAGNPTKWIPINDNGTIRNIPAW